MELRKGNIQNPTVILRYCTSTLTLYFRLFYLCSGYALPRLFPLILSEDLKNCIFFLLSLTYCFFMKK